MSDIRDIYTKKKKIKPKAKPIGNIRIIDDDVSLNDLIPDNIGNTLEDDLYKNEPVIAEIIDERPEIIKQLEEYTTGKWKRLAEDDDDDIKIKVEPSETDDFDALPRQSKQCSDVDNEDMDFIRRKRSSKETNRRSGEVKSSDIKIKEEKKDHQIDVDETQVRVRKPTAKELEKKAREEERKQKYAEWGKGLKQKKEREAKLESDLAEAEKPLARYIDDKDLDKILREQEREDDPMLKYIKKKGNDEDNENGEKPSEKKRYNGVALANRYNILPGYRWDGVDRSNGFEKKYFESIANRKAREAEAFKWSIEDM